MRGTFTDEEWRQIFDTMREAEAADAKAWQQRLYDGENGEFWQFVDEQIREVRRNESAD